MPSRFRQKPSSRRAARPTASWLVLGSTLAGKVARGERTTHLIPVRPSDHHRRYHPEQRLSVKAFVGGATLAHVHVTTAQRVQLRDVNYPTARELGHIRVDAFKLAWIREHDEQWWRGVQERLNGAPPTEETFGEFMERFDRRHGHRWVWLIRFALDRSAAPRLLAADNPPGSYRLGSDKRWHYVERHKEQETENDHGYTSVPARALPGEAEALGEDEWKRHIHDTRDLTHEQWVALGRIVSLGEKARAHAERGRNMRRRAA